MKRTIMAAIMAVAVTLVGIQGASAKHHRHSHYARSINGGQMVAHPAGCPWHAFCGCGVSVKIFGHPIRELFLAANWFRFPRAAPGPGMVAVRRHHVMAIIAYNGNSATVYDPNSGHRGTRIHERSLAGFTVVNPTRYAAR